MKQIYAVGTIVLLLLNIYVMTQAVPRIIKENNTTKLVVVNFKNDSNKKIEEKYGEEKYQKLFIKTNEKLKKSKKVFLVTRQKDIKKIEKDEFISSVDNSKADSYVLDEEAKNLGTLPMVTDGNDYDVWDFLFPKLTVLNLLNLFILLIVFIKRKTKKVSS